MNVVDKYSLDMSGATDNAAKLALLGSDIAGLYAAKRPLPRLVFTEGVFSFSAWPDLAYPNLQIVGCGECRLVYIGPGDGIVFDGSLRNPSAGQPGIDNFTFEGFDIYAAATGIPLWFKGIHRSKLSARVLMVNGNANLRPAIAMNFCIVTRIHPVVSSGRQGPSCTGLLLDAWPGKPNLQTTACTIQDPCLEGCATGLLYANAASCAAYNGTIENCGTGVELGAGAGNNMHYNVEMEGNGLDVYAANGAHSNGFMYCGNSGKLNTSWSNFQPFSSNWAKN